MRWTREAPTRRSSVLRMALMLPLSCGAAQCGRHVAGAYVGVTGLREVGEDLFGQLAVRAVRVRVGVSLRAGGVLRAGSPLAGLRDAPGRPRGGGFRGGRRVRCVYRVLRAQLNPPGPTSRFPGRARPGVRCRDGRRRRRVPLQRPFLQLQRGRDPPETFSGAPDGAGRAGRACSARCRNHVSLSSHSHVPRAKDVSTDCCHCHGKAQRLRASRRVHRHPLRGRADETRCDKMCSLFRPRGAVAS